MQEGDEEGDELIFWACSICPTRTTCVITKDPKITVTACQAIRREAQEKIDELEARIISLQKLLEVSG